MKKYTLFFFILFLRLLPGFSQNTTNLLLGRWEVVKYAEQGIQVDKKAPAGPQALDVYQQVQATRAKVWYGFDYDNADEYSRRRAREFQRWEERDSLKEVRRIAEAIETPYFAVFFPDSTLALYNKDTAGHVSNPESRQYRFAPGTMSIDIYPASIVPQSLSGNRWIERSEVQILFLSATNMTLFIPEEAEIVELVKTAFTMP